MMNRESGPETGRIAMRVPANQLELVSFGSQLPGLVAGELALICEP
jgi:hypothetical protein